MLRSPVCFLLCVVLIVEPAWSNYKKEDRTSPVDKEKLKSVDLPPCKLCRVLVDSFMKGMERTSKSNFQGGDAAWEEEKLGDYASSEVRFIEIQEKLCDDVTKGNSQCHSLAENIESKLEEWWFKNRQTQPDLYQWLCVLVLEHCCPLDHYGPNCVPCPGYPNNVCSGNGKCKGSGIRKGSGICVCDEGYVGDNCNLCANTFYKSYQDESKLLCSKCHQACLESCTQAGPRGCLGCKKGWSHQSELGCVDINECVSETSPCRGNEFCVNNEGSYTCLECDKVCNGCHGDGPDMCDKCADGHLLKDGMCMKDSSEWETRGDDIRRYITYLGLCIATCIIFQKNPIIASLIGLTVAVYVAISEYMLGVSSSEPIFKF